ncbi:hypothetical protein BDQ17DRAFT_1230217 [Cyathus striatus]|nr:hypothetical protein BDQ17DRAFT_1230217 [Cyathus striatus]
MANVLHHHIDFHPRPVSHAPSPFGFGFGLISPASPTSPWQTAPTPGHTNPAAFHQLSLMNHHASSSRPQKRRHESEDDSDTLRDQSMDRSPTPERPKRAAPKRARMVHSPDPNSKEDGSRKDNKADDDDVDVGVLLASLPPQSLLPLLNSLLKAQPSLKSTILPLIPRPTLETAIQALAQSAKKLQDAYPYSNSTSFSASTPSFGFGRSHATPMFGQSGHTSSHAGGMRDSYVLSRLRPHITDFVAACMSYLPYFTCIPPSPRDISLHSDSTLPSLSATTIQSLHKDKFHPSETYLFLSAVTNHIIAQPPLAQTSLCTLLLPRLVEEWNTWVDKVDDVVNCQGGMFGRDTVQSWERGLDSMADAKIANGITTMREVRDKWVAKVGWLVGRTVHHPMDEI